MTPPTIRTRRTSTRAAVITVAALLAGTLAAASPAAAQNTVTTVVQLGDSYSAGYGVLSADEPASSGSCTDPDRSRPEVTPGGVLAANTGANLIFAACGGAEIPEVLEQFRSVVGQIPGDGTGTVVVFTAGGNDLRSVRGEMWTELVTRCILWDWSCEKRSKNQVANLDQVEADMAALVAEIAMAAPGATVRVLGYPELMQRTPGCWGMTGIDRNEADFMDGIARALNDTLEAAVNTAVATHGGDITFTNPEAAFDDHGACQVSWSGERYVNDVDFVPWSITTAANSLHPTADGYAAYAGLLAASL